MTQIQSINSSFLFKRSIQINVQKLHTLTNTSQDKHLSSIKWPKRFKTQYLHSSIIQRQDLTRYITGERIIRSEPRINFKRKLAEQRQSENNFCNAKASKNNNFIVSTYQNRQKLSTTFKAQKSKSLNFSLYVPGIRERNRQLSNSIIWKIPFRKNRNTIEKMFKQKQEQKQIILNKKFQLEILNKKKRLLEWNSNRTNAESKHLVVKSKRISNLDELIFKQQMESIKQEKIVDKS